MNLILTLPEIAVVALGLVLLLLDLWIPDRHRNKLAYAAAGGLVVVLIGTFFIRFPSVQYAFGQMYVLDGLALFFKRLFLITGLVVIFIAAGHGPRLSAEITEYYVLVLFAIAGMMWAASANDFILLFVSIELIAVCFYILNSYERGRLPSLEAGVKYLILSACASAFLIYGIALLFGSFGSLSYNQIALAPQWPLMAKAGLALVMVGLGFKIAAFPFQMWTPDVYQGAPVPTSALLAAGSKAAGFVLLLRVLFGGASDITHQWQPFWMWIAAITILYGNLCAIPQRNIKRLMGYSSIAHAGYLLIGVAVISASGVSAVLYYLAGYILTVLAAFVVVGIVVHASGDEDMGALAGLYRRSPLLATSLTLAMVSLAGIPPLAGFFGKFFLIKAAVEQLPVNQGFYWLIGVALLGVVISLYYYLGVVRVIFWGKSLTTTPPLKIIFPLRLSLYGCMAGILYLGILPGTLLRFSDAVAQALRFK